MNNDCLFYVFGFLNINSIVSCMCVCSRFYGVIQNEILWKRLFDEQLWAIKSVRTNYYCNFKKCYAWDKLLMKHMRYGLNIKIYCDYIHLHNCNIYKLPEGIELFNYIKILRLDGNKLSTLPVEIGQCYTLEKLYLNSNQLYSIPNTIGSLTSLQFLDLSRNNLSTLPREIGQCCALQTLHLQYNKLVDLPCEINLFSQLCELSIENNPLQTISCSIENISTLRNLWMNRHQQVMFPNVNQKIKYCMILIIFFCL